MSAPIALPATPAAFMEYQERILRRKLTAAEREATAEWLDIFNDISTGNLDSTVAMERINYLIDHTEDPARLRFLRAAREWIIYAWKGAQ